MTTIQEFLQFWEKWNALYPLMPPGLFRPKIVTRTRLLAMDKKKVSFEGHAEIFSYTISLGMRSQYADEEYSFSLVGTVADYEPTALTMYYRWVGNSMTLTLAWACLGICSKTLTFLLNSLPHIQALVVKVC